MLHIRNKYLQEFYEKTADYKNAFFIRKKTAGWTILSVMNM